MKKIKFKSRNQKLQKQEHHPESEFADCSIRDENDTKVDEHPVKGVAIYEKE